MRALRSGTAWTRAAGLLAASLLVAPGLAADAFVVKGNGAGGLYSELTGTLGGRPVQLALERIPHVLESGGLRMEWNPGFRIHGISGAGPVAFSVVLEDRNARLGAVVLCTGHVAHVRGAVGARRMDLVIRDREVASDAGGLVMQSEAWKELVSAPAGHPFATLRPVIETASHGGVLVQSVDRHVFAGTDAGRPFRLTLRRWLGDRPAVEGNAGLELVIAVLALRPFLAPGGR